MTNTTQVQMVDSQDWFPVSRQRRIERVYHVGSEPVEVVRVVVCADAVESQCWAASSVLAADRSGWTTLANARREDIFMAPQRDGLDGVAAELLRRALTVLGYAPVDRPTVLHTVCERCELDVEVGLSYFADGSPVVESVLDRGSCSACPDGVDHEPVLA